METLESATTYILNSLSLEDSLEERRLIETELEQTAGKTTTNQKVYRKHYVIGLRLWLSLDNNLLSGEGAKFDQNFETTRRHLVWQQLQDKNLVLNVPADFLCERLLTQIASPPADLKPKVAIGFLSF